MVYINAALKRRLLGSELIRLFENHYLFFKELLEIPSNHKNFFGNFPYLAIKNIAKAKRTIPIPAKNSLVEPVSYISYTPIYRDISDTGAHTAAIIPANILNGFLTSLLFIGFSNNRLCSFFFGITPFQQDRHLDIKKPLI